MATEDALDQGIECVYAAGDATRGALRGASPYRQHGGGVQTKRMAHGFQSRQPRQRAVDMVSDAMANRLQSAPMGPRQHVRKRKRWGDEVNAYMRQRRPDLH
eukprot:4016493-Pyramimonas_sp.AAC.1